MERPSNNLRRRVEELDYWRKRAGWFDDDESMKEFNTGVYDTYYQIDDDQALQSATSGKSKSSSASGAKQKGLNSFLKIASGLLAVALCLLVLRAITRRVAPAKKASKEGKSSKRSESKSRSGRSSSGRSTSGRSTGGRSRSGRSRSRSKKSSSASNYDLMDDKTETQSRKSTRSRSRSRRSRSKSSRTRSKSKARASEPAAKDVVLV